MWCLRLLVTLLLTLASAGPARTTVGNWDACGVRLERALDALHRDSTRRNRLEEEEAGTSYQQELRSAPLEMSVSRIAVKLPQAERETSNPWARVERCTYEPDNNSLQTRVMFNDLSVSGMVSLVPRDRQAPIPAETCRMTLRLRRAGIDFLTSPIARGRGQMRIRTESSFLEPRFASIYAYGCHPTRLDKQIKRQDKWPPFYPTRDEYSTLPAPPSDNYEAAEPRQLLGVSKDVDVVIPNEGRRPRFSHTPLAKLGIWRKNVWVTKSPLRKRRSAVSATATDHRTPETEPQTLDPSSRALSSVEIITPQDFASALNRKKSKTEDISEAPVLSTESVLLNSTESLLSGLNESETKSNFKRQDNFGSMREDAQRETRELYLEDEHFDNVFPAEFDGPGTRSWQSKEHIAREMEDVFLHGASQALTRYIERQLHPAIKETLMLSMGYTISYG